MVPPWLVPKNRTPPPEVGGRADEVGGHGRARGHAVAGGRRTGSGRTRRHGDGVAALYRGVGVQVRADEAVSTAHGRGGAQRDQGGSVEAAAALAA